MKQLLKSLVFAGGTKPRHVMFGAGRGLALTIDPQTQSQRLLGLAEIEISDEFVRLAKRCKTFCDVGANDGWYGLLARKHNPQVSIVAMEADAKWEPLAREHFRLNRFSDAPIRWLNEFCGTTAYPLDRALAGASEPIFIKMDIEGGELDALKSGEATLASKDCSLIVEIHSPQLEEQCTQWLQQRGYSVRVVAHSALRKFVPENRPAFNRWLVVERAAKKG